MLKKKVEQKKKKISLNNNKNNPKLNIQSFTDKLMMKVTSRLSPKSHLLSSTQFSKAIKSGISSPLSKTRKHTKQNLCSTTAQSKKTSETMTPFDYESEMKKTKSKFDFCFLYQIGSGGFGRVWKVEQKKTKIVYAMKQMSKAKVISKKSVSSIMNEKQLLDELQGPFIINSCSNFQDRDNLYLVMEYLRGGDLRYHMCFYEKGFTQQQTKFIVGCIVVGLEYIHSCNIIHRDLKPENIVFQESGYARITDFGVARKRREDNCEDTSGTPGYMSPEVICRMNHSFETDYFALGVIIYQLIFGYRPYVGDSRKQIRQKILAHQARIHERQLPQGWNLSCVDFVNGLLKRNKESRLGYHGISEIKNHQWLKSINWKKLQKKQIYPPFVPGIACESPQYQREMQNTVPSEVNEDAKMLLRTTEIQKLFKNYDNVCKKVQCKIRSNEKSFLGLHKKIL